MLSNALFSSNSDEWATPQWIFDELDHEFGFTLDPCATEENHKCCNYFTAEDDGLKQNWGGKAFSLIHHILEFLIGLRSAFMKHSKITPQLSC